MGNVAKKLKHSDLIQISRSHFVNHKHIKLIRGNEVKLTVGAVFEDFGFVRGMGLMGW